MEPTMEEKLKACIQLCEEGDPEMCAFLGGEFYYGMNVPQDLDRAKRYLAVAASTDTPFHNSPWASCTGPAEGPNGISMRPSDCSFSRPSKASRRRCTTSHASFSQRMKKRTRTRP